MARRDRTEIAGALKQQRESVAGSVLTAMEYRRLVLKEGDRYSLPKGIAATSDTLSAKIEALIDAAREAHYDDETIADALEDAAAVLREGLT
jgi:predicted nucleic acid-binding protein